MGQGRAQYMGNGTVVCHALCVGARAGRAILLCGFTILHLWVYEIVYYVNRRLTNISLWGFFYVAIIPVRGYNFALARWGTFANNVFFWTFILVKASVIK